MRVSLSMAVYMYNITCIVIHVAQEHKSFGVIDILEKVANSNISANSKREIVILVINTN